MIDEVLRAGLGGVGDGLGRLALGADEQHAAALGDDVGHRKQRLMQERHGLGEIDDVDVVAGAVDERRHLRVPAMGLVTEMHAGLEQLAHSDIGQCHWTAYSFFRFGRRGTGRPSLSPVTGASAKAWKGLVTLSVPRVRWCGL